MALPPPKFTLLALPTPWSPKDWQPSAGQLLVTVLVLTPEQAPSSKVPAIITTLTRFEIIFQFPLGWRRGCNILWKERRPRH